MSDSVATAADKTEATEVAAAAARAVDKAAHHYGWNADTAARAAELEAAGAVPAIPKRLDSSESGDAVASSISPSGGASAWNKAGTWESRDVTTKAFASLRTAVTACGPFALAPAGAVAGPWSLRLKSVTTITGSATLVFSRGRAKPGYEVTLALAWEAVDAAGSHAADGTLHFVDVSDVEGSDIWASWRVTVDNVAPAAGAEKTAVATSARGLAEPLRAFFREWAEGLAKL